MSAPATSIVALTRRLIRQPSRAGIDSYEPVVATVEAWLARRDVAVERLTSEGRVVGLTSSVRGARRGPAFMLNATLDTAPFGDVGRWRAAPTSGALEKGWLYGRGAADSKVAVAMFAHLAAELQREATHMRGTLVLLFDLDEHTGAFTGIRRFFERPRHVRPAGVYIGYPGAERIVTGGRGFLRAIVSVHGQAAHSGASHRRGVNAATRAADLVARLVALDLPQNKRDPFPLPPAVTVTAIHGGEGFSLVPDACAVHVDMRLTPRFGERAARALLRGVVSQVDRAAGSVPKSKVAWLPGRPAYRLPDHAPLVVALQSSAQRRLGRPIPTAVAGPSNIGNYLATLKIPAVCGFGVDFRAIHALDERLRVASIAPAYLAYRDALRVLLGMSSA